MPRAPRINLGGIVYHVLNRANARVPLFESSADYDAFLSVLSEAHLRVPMRTIGYCILPNHWHLVLWPHEDGDLSEFMRWLTVTHSQRWHGFRHSAGTGHIYQGRFKSFPVQQHPPGSAARSTGALEAKNAVLSVLRYVERNPLKAALATRAEAWPWSSASARLKAPGAMPLPLTPPPGGMPRDWTDLVNRPQTEDELLALQRSVLRGAPFGQQDWVIRMAAEWGLDATLRPRGRPPKGSGTFLR